jgi:hypothetical protein
MSGQDVLLRENQLLGKGLNNSLLIRPIIINKFNSRNKLIDSLLPLQIETKFNSKRPYGWNDGSFIGAKGLQFRLSTGYLLRTKFFELQARPEFVSAENIKYKTTAGYGDAPHGSYHKFLAGQSFLNFTTGPIYLGFSNENLWWGPGQFDALVFSNNAPGFGHLQVGTRRPIKNPVMDIEFQIIAGGLDQDSLLNSEAFSQRMTTYVRDWRYLSAITMSLQPKIIPGLYVGFSRALQQYHTSLDTSSKSFMETYLPAITAFLKKKINTQASAPNGNDSRDQQASVFLRMVLPKSHFETYFEYGYNDFKDNIRDWAADAQHSSAYIIGFKKLIPQKVGKYINVSGEVTQIAQSPDYVVRDAGNWYVHSRIVQGFTHLNQILGAGSGLGNNVQTILIEKVEGQKRLGFKIQRIQNDPKRLVGDLNTQFLGSINWTDITYGPSIQWTRNKWICNVEVQFVHSNNYGWEYGSLFNLFTGVNLTYKW